MASERADRDIINQIKICIDADNANALKPLLGQISEESLFNTTESVNMEGGIHHKASHPLLYAAREGKKACIKLLLDHYPDLTTIQNMTESAALYATVSDETVHMSFLGRPPTLAMKQDMIKCAALYDAAYAGHKSIVELLLDRHPELAMVQSNGGRIVLHGAVRVELLLGRHPELAMVCNEHGETALHKAAVAGYESVCRLLLDRCPDLATERGFSNSTALHVAAYAGHEPVCRLLLDRCPGLAMKHNGDGETALHKVAYEGHESICRLLLDRCPGLAMEGDDWRNTALHKAAYGGHESICRLLLNRCPGLAMERNEDGETVLHGAAYGGRESVCRLLLEYKPALANTRDSRGNTVLHKAAYQGHESVVELLLENSPELAVAKCHQGNTPLHAAVKHGHSDMVKLLLVQDEVRLDTQNRYGKTILHMHPLLPFLPFPMYVLDRMYSLGASESTLLLRDGGGRIPLHYAVEIGMDAVNCLFDKAGYQTANTMFRIVDTPGNSSLDSTSRAIMVDKVVALQRWELREFLVTAREARMVCERTSGAAGGMPYALSREVLGDPGEVLSRVGDRSQTEISHRR